MFWLRRQLSGRSRPVPRVPAHAMCAVALRHRIFESSDFSRGPAEETMSKDQLGDRAKAMEESFFAKQNEALRQRLRESEETKTKKQALSAASGVTDDGLLDKLVALNLRAKRRPPFPWLPWSWWLGRTAASTAVSEPRSFLRRKERASATRGELSTARAMARRATTSRNAD
jgi:hypothetical protein